MRHARELIAWAAVAVLGCGPSRPASTIAPEPVPRAPAVAESAPRSEPEVPQPVAVRINRDYADAEHTAKWTRNFESGTREAFARRDDIVAVLGLVPGSTVADVGAGTGLFTMAFAAVVGPAGRVFAVDPQAAFLEHIQARAAREGFSNVQTVQASQQSSGLAPDAVDVVFLCDAYHHLELPGTYLADLHRALHPGGRLVIVDYDRTRAGGRARREHVRADPAQFRAEIEAAGFELVAEPALLRENFVMVFARIDGDQPSHTR